MLSIADTPWQIISATIVFGIGLYIALAQKRLFRVPAIYAVGLYLWHTVFCVYYYFYSLSNIADATTYYLYSFDIGEPFSLGTVGVYYLVSIFSDLLGMSYFGVFLVFNIVGYLGLIAFASALREMPAYNVRIGRYAIFAIMLLPSLSFWSTAPGKDALIMLSAGLACWGACRIHRRYIALLVAVAVLLLARPHIAAVMILCLGAAVPFAKDLRPRTKSLILIASVPAVFLAIVFAISYVGFQEGGGLTDVADYVETRQGLNLEGGSSVDISSMSVPVRMFTYLFRPLFFDANGMNQLIISVENVTLILLFMAAAYRISKQKSSLPIFQFWFFVSFCVISWIMLANTTANLGIAVRQKWMFLPMLILILMSYIGGLRVQRGPELPGASRGRIRIA